MDLFTPHGSPPPNLLPCDGSVTYHGPILSQAAAKRIFDALEQEVHWEQDEVVIYGRRHVTQRRTAWHADAPLAYTYSHTTKVALPWTPALLTLKELAEARSGRRYNACLLNRYADGSQGMGWHSDDEDTIVPDSAIASLSLGAERRFDLRHRKTGEKVQVMLENGSLLVMEGETQRHWLHSLPKALRVKNPRINLTFRQMR